MVPGGHQSGPGTGGEQIRKVMGGSAGFPHTGRRRSPARRSQAGECVAPDETEMPGKRVVRRQRPVTEPPCRLDRRANTFRPHTVC